MTNKKKVGALVLFLLTQVIFISAWSDDKSHNSPVNSAQIIISTSSSGVVSNILCSPNEAVVEKTATDMIGRFAVWDPVRNKAYIFGAISGVGGAILEYDPSLDKGTIKKEQLPQEVLGLTFNIINETIISLAKGDIGIVYTTWDSKEKKVLIFTISDNSIKVFEYDPVLGTTIQKQQAPLPNIRIGESKAWDPNNKKLYFFGGSENGKGHSTAFNQISEYDLLANKFTIKTETLPVTLTKSAAVWDTNLNKAYIFGGLTGIRPYNQEYRSLVSVNTIIEYDPQTGSVLTKKETFPLDIDSTIAVWDPVRNKAYIFGGIAQNDGEARQQDTIYEYDPQLQRLIAKTGKLKFSDKFDPLSQNAYNHIFPGSAIFATLNNKIYLFGIGPPKNPFPDSVLESWGITPSVDNLSKVLEFNTCTVSPSFTGIWKGIIKASGRQKKITLDLCTRDNLIAGLVSYPGTIRKNLISTDTLISETEAIIKLKSLIPGKSESITLKLDGEKLSGTFNDGATFLAKRVSALNSKEVCPFKTSDMDTN